MHVILKYRNGFRFPRDALLRGLGRVSQAAKKIINPSFQAKRGMTARGGRNLYWLPIFGAVLKFVYNDTIQ